MSTGQTASFLSTSYSCSLEATGAGGLHSRLLGLSQHSPGRLWHVVFHPPELGNVSTWERTTGPWEVAEVSTGTEITPRHWWNRLSSQSDFSKSKRTRKICCQLIDSNSRHRENLEKPCSARNYCHQRTAAALRNFCTTVGPQELLSQRTCGGPCDPFLLHYSPETNAHYPVCRQLPEFTSNSFRWWDL